ncbi:MAG: autotransporter outer membrane beta-barrel domain-containing protein [Pigmentiphaga sp.]|nr:autotransporter outer membrane beta-barrel domain-containing protein [Pigmentiphaga sp.]
MPASPGRPRPPDRGTTPGARRGFQRLKAARRCGGARNRPPGWIRRHGCIVILSLGPLALSTPASATCQNVLCVLPDSWLLPGPFHAVDKLPVPLEASKDRDKAPRGEGPGEAFAAITGSHIRKSDTADEDGYAIRSLGAQLGAVREVVPDTFVGYTLAYQDSRQHANDDLSRVDSRLYYAGLAMERHWGGWRLHGVIGAGHGRHRIQRGLLGDDPSAVGRSRVGSYYAALGSGLSYRFEDAGWYLEPAVGITLLYERTPSYREQGLGGQSLRVKRSEDLKTMLAPAIALGRRVETRQAHWLFWLSAGLNLLPDNTSKTRSHTVAEPGFELIDVATMPRASGDFRAGLALAGSQRWSIQAEYALQTGSHFRSHGGALRLMLTF